MPKLPGKIETIRCDSNQLKKIPNFPIPNKLTYLDCSRNNLVELPEGITDIEKVIYNRNPIYKEIHKYSYLELYDMKK